MKSQLGTFLLQTVGLVVSGLVVARWYKRPYKSEKKPGRVDAFFITDSDVRKQCDSPGDHDPRLPNARLELLQ